MRKAVIISAAFFLFAGLAAAQIPTGGNVYFGYTYYNTNLSVSRGSLNGWEGTLEGKLFPLLGIVADVTGHYGSQQFPEAVTCPVGVTPCGPVSVTANAHVYEALFGPRLSVPVGKFRPFGEFELGVGHVNTNGFGTDTSFATAVGGGLDYTIVRPVAWRFQGDYIRTKFFNRTDNNLRLSTGIVFRF
jgi:Outer membrane protein beta-barrel domain